MLLFCLDFVCYTSCWQCFNYYCVWLQGKRVNSMMLHHEGFVLKTDLTRPCIRFVCKDIWHPCLATGWWMCSHSTCTAWKTKRKYWDCVVNCTMLSVSKHSWPTVRSPQTRICPTVPDRVYTYNCTTYWRYSIKGHNCTRITVLLSAMISKFTAVTFTDRFYLNIWQKAQMIHSFFDLDSCAGHTYEIWKHQ